MTTTASLLRAAGIKATPARMRVLDALRAARQPLSHADLEALLPDADRVTIYRVLDALVACGLALKAADARGVFRFSASGERREHRGHVHFRCTDLPRGCAAPAAEAAARLSSGRGRLRRARHLRPLCTPRRPMKTFRALLLGFALLWTQLVLTTPGIEQVCLDHDEACSECLALPGFAA